MVAQVPDHSEQSCASLEERLAAAEAEVARLSRELAEARDQQSTMAEIHRAIAASPSNAQPVVDAVIQNALRLSGSTSASLGVCVGDELHVMASINSWIEPGFVNTLSQGTVTGRAIRERRTIHVPDRTDPAVATEFPGMKHLLPMSTLTVPLIHNGEAIGGILVGRDHAHPYSPDEIALVETFAAQAAIAVANARLFEQLQESNRRVTEALEQQTATAEIQRIIASSPNDLEHVLDCICEAATRVAGASISIIWRVEGDVLRLAGGDGAVGDLRSEVRPLDPRFTPARAVLEARPIRIADSAAKAADFEVSARLQQRLGHRSTVFVPLVRDGVSIGSLGVGRTELRPFTDREVALLEAFADQAVIAIENARLFEELRDRTTELAELNQNLETRVSEQVEQLERVGRLRRYLSPQLAELIVSSGDESILASHRRRITVVFCDLRGFTAFAETEEPEEVMAVLGEYHTVMGDLIRTYEGTFGHFAGDGLMVFFNDPLPQPDHVERAVRMACVMRERAADLARGWRRAGYELGFGIGIAVGYATLGRIGFEGRYDYDVIGTVANLAARLCAEAAGGQILIPARLHGMVESLVEAETVGELTLKGLHRPVEAFNITGLREDQSLPLDQATGHAVSGA